MSRTHRVRLAVTAVPFVLALSGCSVVTAFTPHVEPAIYDTAKEFAAADSSAFGSPAFVPDDATVIRVDYDTETGEAIMTYASKVHVAEGTCTGQTATPKPTIQDSWWPITGLPATVSDCGGGWSAFTVGDQVYAARKVASTPK